MREYFSALQILTGMQTAGQPEVAAQICARALKQVHYGRAFHLSPKHNKAVVKACVPSQKRTAGAHGSALFAFTTTRSKACNPGWGCTTSATLRWDFHIEGTSPMCD